jgi:hypothetical protein
MVPPHDAKRRAPLSNLSEHTQPGSGPQVDRIELEAKVAPATFAALLTSLEHKRDTPDEQYPGPFHTVGSPFSLSAITANMDTDETKE